MVAGSKGSEGPKRSIWYYASRGRGSVPPWRRGGRGRGRSPAAVEPPGEEGASVVPETEELPEEAPVEETGPEPAAGLPVEEPQLGGAEEGPEELASGPDWSPNEESVAQQAAETERILAKLLEEPEEPPKKRKKKEDKPPEPKKPARKGWIVNRSTEASASDSDAWGNWRSPLIALAAPSSSHPEAASS